MDKPTQEQNLLLTEIRETLDKLTTSWYRDDKEAWLDVASEDILPKVLKASKNKCVYCDKKPDGAMLTMGFQMAHATCVIQKLNELLDPNYDGGEPDKVVGFLAGYKSQEEVEARIQEAEKQGEQEVLYKLALKWIRDYEQALKGGT